MTKAHPGPRWGVAAPSVTPQPLDRKGTTMAALVTPAELAAVLGMPQPDDPRLDTSCTAADEWLVQYLAAVDAAGHPLTTAPMKLTGRLPSRWLWKSGRAPLQLVARVWVWT